MAETFEPDQARRTHEDRERAEIAKIASDARSRTTPSARNYPDRFDAQAVAELRATNALLSEILFELRRR